LYEVIASGKGLPALGLRENKIPSSFSGFFFPSHEDGSKTFTIQINQPTRCNSFTGLLLDVYVWLNMFRAPLRPSSGAYNCTKSLWVHRWSVAVGTLLVVVWQTCQTTTNNAPTVNPEAPSTFVRP